MDETTAFKTNPYLERAVMTGITRVSKESIFSDLNNLNIVTTTSSKYAESFGFTEKEVFAAMDEYGYPDKAAVKRWYDGFIFGDVKDIYNPWSIINFLDKGKLTTYWANTSGNSLVSKLIREGSRDIKMSFERLLRGEDIRSKLDEQIVYSSLNGNSPAILSLLLAGGYLKVLEAEAYEDIPEGTDPLYTLALTNYEVQIMFRNMVENWFSAAAADYNDFVRALLADDVEAMNGYMNRVALSTFSYFDAGRETSLQEPERFYQAVLEDMILCWSREITRMTLLS